MLGSCQCLRYAVYQRFIGGGSTFMHQSGKAAQKIHPAGRSGFFQGQGKGHKILCAACGGNKGNRGYGNTLVDNRYAVFRTYFLSHAYKAGGLGGDLRQQASTELSAQSSREMPIVIVRISRCCLSIILSVSVISKISSIATIPLMGPFQCVSARMLRA